VRRLLASGTAVGEVKLVKAYFGSPQLHIPRSVERELGGGALLDIGVYCLQFVLMVFDGERPESIQATGVLLDSGWTGAVDPLLLFFRIINSHMRLMEWFMVMIHFCVPMFDRSG